MHSLSLLALSLTIVSKSFSLPYPKAKDAIRIVEDPTEYNLPPMPYNDYVSDDYSYFIGFVNNKCKADHIYICKKSGIDQVNCENPCAGHGSCPSCTFSRTYADCFNAQGKEALIYQVLDIYDNPFDENNLKTVKDVDDLSDSIGRANDESDVNAAPIEEPDDNKNDESDEIAKTGNKIAEGANKIAEEAAGEPDENDEQIVDLDDSESAKIAEEANRIAEEVQKIAGETTEDPDDDDEVLDVNVDVEDEDEESSEDDE